MEKKELYIGLDIGTTKIVAMIGVINEYDKLKIIGVGKSKSLGVHRGVVNNISVKEHAYTKFGNSPVNFILLTILIFAP